MINTGCIPFTGKLNKYGYGSWRWRRPDGTRGSGAHVLAWEKEKGRVPDGLELHHACLNRACLNVEHMQALSRSEHKALHAILNTVWRCGHDKDKVSPRYCRPCRNSYCRAYQMEWRKTHPRRATCGQST